MKDTAHFQSSRRNVEVTIIIGLEVDPKNIK